ncbi:MAG: ABC transporter ATP-binding protein [Acidobacteriia bacterium]|nr:ABC transporter ATP-binding protein [Terriglobia bacterium]
MRDAIIRAENLTKKYRSGDTDLVVLNRIEFAVARGERVAVTGASGSGKSTLLHLLGALDRPSSGQIYFEGSDIFAWKEEEMARFRNREVGYVWQQQALLPEFTALENVMMPLLVRGPGQGMDRSSAERQARVLLDEVGLAARGSHRAGELSGGEQQRVALARALVTRPKLLLADEPTGNLDHATGEAVAALLGQVHRTHGLTSVIVTHNLEFAKSCDRVLQLERGDFSPREAESSSRAS